MLLRDRRRRESGGRAYRDVSTACRGTTRPYSRRHLSRALRTTPQRTAKLELIATPGTKTLPSRSAEVHIRKALEEDSDPVAVCVQAAYAVYVPRMEKKPAPMLADYHELVKEGVVYIISMGDACAGLIVMFPRDANLFVENIAVHPNYQGLGLGRHLMEFAACEAERLGLPEIRLYTNAHMTENLEFYPSMGFEQTERRSEDGYDRVYFRKRVLTKGEGVWPDSPQ